MEKNTKNETAFLEALRKQLKGLGNKVLKDFAKDGYEQELALLKSDSVYPKFSFDRPEYVLIRLMGRISISVGRRLGEIYDKIPRILATIRYGLNLEDVAPVFGGLELDIGLQFPLISKDGQDHIKDVLFRHTKIKIGKENGMGAEIRYNFNPNDSSRLRKDVKMAELLIEQGLVPIYLVFSSISPREDAIARLKRAGWHFIVGKEAQFFLKEVLGEDFLEILDKPEVKSEISKEVDSIMEGMINSYAFQEVVKKSVFIPSKNKQ